MPVWRLRLRSAPMSGPLPVYREDGSMALCCGGKGGCCKALMSILNHSSPRPAPSPAGSQPVGPVEIEMWLVMRQLVLLWL
ncbi:unnamed protein product [Arctogadus glacialis]